MSRTTKLEANIDGVELLVTWTSWAHLAHAQRTKKIPSRLAEEKRVHGRKTDFKAGLRPPALTRAHSELPASARQRPTTETADEFVYNDAKLKVTSPGTNGPMDAEERAEFKKVHGAIEKSFCFHSRNKSTKVGSDSKAMACAPLKGQAAVAVNKWVDYSNKYGVGYLLTNGNVGVYFNDSSQIIVSRNGHNFEYVPRRGQSCTSNREAHTITNYPSSLKKKVTLLNHFNVYLKNKSSRGKATSTDQGPVVTGNMVYVKKWLRTNHAILFRLSNQTVQVIFFDQTEILLSSSTRIVVYTDKARKVTQYPLDTVVDSPRPDLARRMRYTQDILFHLLSSGRKRRGSV